MAWPSAWVMGMRLPPNSGGRYARAFEKMYEDVARDRKVPLMPFFLDGVGAFRSAAPHQSQGRGQKG